MGQTMTRSQFLVPGMSDSDRSRRAKRREQEREERRNRILDAAEATFYEHGLEKATMDEVAQRAQLAKGTLYLYFNSKEDLLLGVVARRQQGVIRAFQDTDAHASTGAEAVALQLRAYAETLGTPLEHLQMAMARWVAAPLHEADSLCASQMQSNIRQMFATFSATVARGQQDGSIRSDLEPRKMALQLWSGVIGALMLRLRIHRRPSIEELFAHAPSIDDAIAFLLSAIRPEAAGGRASGTHSARGAATPSAAGRTRRRGAS